MMEEHQNIQRDQSLINSKDCNNPELLALYSDLAQSCGDARRRNQLQFYTRIKEKLLQYGCVFWEFVIDHQPLKLWYLQLCLPVVFVIYLAFRSSNLKEQTKQDAQFKIFKETIEMQRANQRENREMYRNLLQLCEKQQDLQHQFFRPLSKPLMITDDNSGEMKDD